MTARAHCLAAVSLLLVACLDPVDLGDPDEGSDSGDVTADSEPDADLGSDAVGEDVAPEVGGDTPTEDGADDVRPEVSDTGDSPLEIEPTIIEGSEYLGRPDAQFGGSLALVEEALLVGALNEPEVVLFVEGGGGLEYAATLTAETPPPGYGRAVAVNFADNDVAVAVVGAPSLGEQPGRVVAFSAADAWETGVDVDGQLNDPTLGAVVALEEDRLAVAAPDAASVELFVLVEGVWLSEGVLMGDDGSGFGEALAFAHVGLGNNAPPENLYAAIGAPRQTVDAAASGAVFLYERPDEPEGEWTLALTLEPDSPSADLGFGSAVAAEWRGALLIGQSTSVLNDLVYYSDPGDWERPIDIDAPDGATLFGRGVAAVDRRLVATGAELVVVYDHHGGSNPYCDVKISGLVPPSGASGQYGLVVAATDERIVWGDPDHDAGRVYVLDLDDAPLFADDECRP